MQDSPRRYDLAIIGGGIVGLATAFEVLQRYPGISLTVVEKEHKIACHQTGHNSGVIHSGVYYKPGSAKARTCTRGAALLQKFCREHGVPYHQCGKVIVARDEKEVPRLQELYERGTANGVPYLRILSSDELREVEPHASGVRALHVPSAAIVNYREVAENLAHCIRRYGGTILVGSRVASIHVEPNGVILQTTGNDLHVRNYIACAGLQSDRVVRLSGSWPPAQIIPFRGEYFKLVPSREYLVRGLIYPVPDLRFPFLGVHFTRLINNGVEAGPNAVLALAREGYSKRAINLRDLAETISFPGLRRLVARHWRNAAIEIFRSFSKRAFVKALSMLIPEISDEDLVPAPSGVRAQAVLFDGSLVDDFLIVEKPRSLHVCNAPSPAATASLAIAQEIVNRAARAFEWKAGKP